MHHQTLSEPAKPVCMMCGSTEPEGGWHTVCCSDGDAEFFCSSQCFNESCDYHGDEDDEHDPAEECGRWQNGRLAKGCSLAGTEWCDWDCPYSR